MICALAPKPPSDTLSTCITGQHFMFRHLTQKTHHSSSNRGNIDVRIAGKNSNFSKLIPTTRFISMKEHERIDGKGFPGKLIEARIPLSAQLLGYSEAFDRLTRRGPGQPSMTPEDAHASICHDRGFSNEVLNKVGHVIKNISNKPN
jgi:response regulator RpfG family c-di-GMP phosphodiesterase